MFIKEKHPQYGRLWRPTTLEEAGGLEWVDGPAEPRAKRRFAPLYKPGPTKIKSTDSV